MQCNLLGFGWWVFCGKLFWALTFTQWRIEVGVAGWQWRLENVSNPHAMERNKYGHVSFWLSTSKGRYFTLSTSHLEMTCISLNVLNRNQENRSKLLYSSLLSQKNISCISSHWAVHQWLLYIRLGGGPGNCTTPTSWYENITKFYNGWCVMWFESGKRDTLPRLPLRPGRTSD